MRKQAGVLMVLLIPVARAGELPEVPEGAGRVATIAAAGLVADVPDEQSGAPTK